MKTLLLLLAMGLVVSLAQPALASCEGCSELTLVADKLRKVSSAKEEEEQNLLEAASKAIAQLPREKNDKLSTLQVRETVNLLRLTVPFDEFRIVIEDNQEVIKANKKEFLDELAKIPQKEAEKIKQDIRLVLSESTFGNDDPPVNAKPSPKSSQTQKKK